MEPQQDQRNFILFIVIAVLFLFAYQALVLEPNANRRKEAAEQARVEQVEGEKIAPVVTLAASVAEAISRDARIPFDGPGVDGSIRLAGAVIDDLSLKNYYDTVKRQNEIRLFRPEAAASAYYAGWFWIDENSLPLVTLRDTWAVVSGDKLTPTTPLVLRFEGANLRIDREISMDENFMFTFKDTVSNTGEVPLRIRPNGSVRRQGDSRVFLEDTTPGAAKDRGAVFLGLMGMMNGRLIKKSYAKLAKGEAVAEISEEGGWIGFTDKYWLGALVPDQSQAFSASFQRIARSNGQLLEVRTVGTEMAIPAGGSITSTQRIFAGAKTLGVLRDYKTALDIPRFDDAIDWGIFYFLTKPFFAALVFLKSYVGSFGLAILAFTVLVKLVLFPLYNRSYASMAVMRKNTDRLKEPMERIQKQFADDPARKQQEIMALYKRENINPLGMLGGCLPLLATMPIFFALYQVLFVTIEMRHEPFIWLQDLAAPDPTAIGNLFGLLPWSAQSVKNIPILGFIIGIGVLPLLYGGTMFVSQSMGTPPTDPMQRKMIMFLPFIFMFVFGGLAGGLVMYFVWNMLLQIPQQYYIMRKNGVDTGFDRFLKQRFGKSESGGQT